MNVVDQMALLHSKKAMYNHQIKRIQDKLRTLEGEERAIQVKILNSLLADQSGINERLKELSVIYHNSVDQLIIKELKKNHNKLFKQLLSKAKESAN